jgi:hypothetical protein
VKVEACFLVFEPLTIGINEVVRGWMGG